MRMQWPSTIRKTAVRGSFNTLRRIMDFRRGPPGTIIMKDWTVAEQPLFSTQPTGLEVSWRHWSTSECRAA